MKSFVLIVFLIGQDFTQNLAMQEFSSEETCNAVAEYINKTLPSGGKLVKQHAVCMPK